MVLALTFRLNHFEAWFSPGEPHGYGTCGGRPTDLSAEGCTLGGGRLGKGCFGVATPFVFRCFALCSPFFIFNHIQNMEPGSSRYDMAVLVFGVCPTIVPCQLNLG